MPKVEAPYLGKTGKVSLNDEVFGEPFNGSLVHEVVRAERNALRSGNASTKSRGDVAMTGAKAWRQKGTGRARIGAHSAGHRRGGGVTFGPTPRNYTFKVNRKARRKAFRAALSLHAGRGTLAIVPKDAFKEPSTGDAFDNLHDWNEKGIGRRDHRRRIRRQHRQVLPQHRPRPRSPAEQRNRRLRADSSPERRNQRRSPRSN